MPRAAKPHTPVHHQASLLSLLTGWVQQSVESFFATQRVLVDVAMRQNAAVMKTLREGFTDPEHSPVALATELAIEGTSSFMEAQRILLNLALQENDIVTNGVKERLAGSAPAAAVTDLFRRSVETFIHMQQDFLKNASKQTMNWLEEIQSGKGFQGTHVVDMARQGMDTFVQAQKKFLDIVAQETAKMTAAKTESAAKHVKKTELSKLAREATTAFIDAQKKLLDVVGQQMNVNLKATTKTLEMLSPTRFLPIADLTGEGVRKFIDAEKTMIESVIKPGNHGKPPNTGEMHAPRPRKAPKVQVAHAG